MLPVASFGEFLIFIAFIAVLAIPSLWKSYKKNQENTYDIDENNEVVADEEFKERM